MAEYISMKQVPGGTVTSVDDRILYDINLTNGKIYGCEVSYLGNNMIHINAGYGVIKGGLFEIEDHTEYVDFAESEPTPGQIYLHFDAAAQDKLTIVKETSANAHQLVQNEDANYESGVYEIQICTFTATTTALTDVTETWPTASGAMETLGTMEEVMANTEAGKVADALVTKQLNSNLTNENNEPFRFAYQNGKRGYWVKEADTDVFVPFSSKTFPIIDRDVDWHTVGTINNTTGGTVNNYNEIWTDTREDYTMMSDIYSDSVDLSKYKKLVVEYEDLTLTDYCFFIITLDNEIRYFINNWGAYLPLINDGSKILYHTDHVSLSNGKIEIDLTNRSGYSRFHFHVTDGVNTIPTNAVCINGWNGSCSIKFTRIYLEPI